MIKLPVGLKLGLLTVGLGSWVTGGYAADGSGRPPRVPASSRLLPNVAANNSESSNSESSSRAGAVNRLLVDPADGGVWDDHPLEKNIDGDCSAATELWVINYDNGQRLAELRKIAGIVQIPGALDGATPEDRSYLTFLAQRLTHYEQVHLENQILGELCYAALDAPPSAIRFGNKLPSVPKHARDTFIRLYGITLLNLYETTVLAYGTVKLASALQKRLVPDLAKLRAQWESEKTRANSPMHVPLARRPAVRDMAHLGGDFAYDLMGGHSHPAGSFPGSYRDYREA